MSNILQVLRRKNQLKCEKGSIYIDFFKMKVESVSRVQLFVSPWTVACQAPLSLEFSRQEYWSGLPFSSPGHLPDPEIEPRSPTLQTDSLLSESPLKLLLIIPS